MCQPDSDWLFLQYSCGCHINITIHLWRICLQTVNIAIFNTLYTFLHYKRKNNCIPQEKTFRWFERENTSLQTTSNGRKYVNSLCDRDRPGRDSNPGNRGKGDRLDFSFTQNTLTKIIWQSTIAFIGSHATRDLLRVLWFSSYTASRGIFELSPLTNFSFFRREFLCSQGVFLLTKNQQYAKMTAK